jgi:hypothetical protein
MAENITKPFMDAVKTTKIVMEEKIVKPVVGAVKTTPKTTVHVAQDVTKMTVDATVCAAGLRPKPEVPKDDGEYPDDEI